METFGKNFVSIKICTIDFDSKLKFDLKHIKFGKKQKRMEKHETNNKQLITYFWI